MGRLLPNKREEKKERDKISFLKVLRSVVEINIEFGIHITDDPQY